MADQEAFVFTDEQLCVALVLVKLGVLSVHQHIALSGGLITEALAISAKATPLKDLLRAYTDRHIDQVVAEGKYTGIEDLNKGSKAVMERNAMAQVEEMFTARMPKARSLTVIKEMLGV